MRGRWHGEAVTDEVEALASTRRSPPHQSPPATASPHRGSLGRFGETAKKLIHSTNLQLQFSIFFCFSKRKRWRVRNGHGGTSRRKRRLLSSVLISSFPNRKLNLRFGFHGKFAATSQSRLRRASIPTPFVPSGHFPLIGGIGPWKGRQGGAPPEVLRIGGQPLSQLR